MPSDHLYAVRRAILVVPVLGFVVGFVLTFLAPELNPLGPVFLFGLVVTVLYALWRMATMLDEIHESI